MKAESGEAVWVKRIGAGDDADAGISRPPSTAPVKASQPSEAKPDMDLRDAIQKIALEWPAYGRPRITAGLRRQGWKVNPKRVQRMMREDNLLASC